MCSEAGVVAAAVLSVKHKGKVKYMSFKLGILAVGAEQVQNIFRGRQLGVGQVNEKTLLFNIEIIAQCFVSCNSFAFILRCFFVLFENLHPKKIFLFFFEKSCYILTVYAFNTYRDKFLSPSNKSIQRMLRPGQAELLCTLTIKQFEFFMHKFFKKE